MKIHRIVIHALSILHYLIDIIYHRVCDDRIFIVEALVNIFQLRDILKYRHIIFLALGADLIALYAKNRAFTLIRI